MKKWFNFSGVDWLLMIPVFILLIFSLATLFSIDRDIFKSQLIFTFLSFGIFLALTQLNPSVLKFYSIPIYIISIIVLGAVLLIGFESRGSVRWIEIFGVNIQFSEIFKPFLALAFATYLSNLRNFSLKSFISIFIFIGPIFMLIFFQPDLGNALIYLMVCTLALIISGFPYRWFFMGFIIWVFTLPFFWMILHDYQRQRVLTFIDPSRDPLGTSYNAIQAVIAVGSGMIIGKGLGLGTQSGLRFLPEQHTDFIYATISEELGFVGAVIIVFCFTFIFFRLYQIIKNSEDKFAKIFSTVAFLIIFVHFVINIGMNLAVVPIVGVTLPFVSYGGSSLLSNFILLGLLFAVNRKSRTSVLEIR